jgi:hypothetical protein
MYLQWLTDRYTQWDAANYEFPNKFSVSVSALFVADLVLPVHSPQPIFFCATELCTSFQSVHLTTQRK